MRAALPTLVLFLSACTVDILDFAGRACDETHPCQGDRRCVAGFCVAPDVSGPGDGGGNPGDSGDLPIDVSCGADAGPCFSGLGECQRSGRWTCSQGKVACSARPGTPAASDSCDGKDNDCDGRPDVGREVLLVGPDAGVNEHLSWVPAPAGGYAAVYESTRAGVHRIFFRRFSADLTPLQSEVELTHSEARQSRSPTIVAMDNDAFVAWTDETTAGVKRVAIRKVSTNNGSSSWFRAFNDEDVLSPPRLAISGTGVDQYVLAVWVRTGRVMVAATLTPGNSVPRTPQQLTVAQYPDGGPHRVVEADALNAGNNDFQVAWTALDEDGGYTIRSRRIHEMLDPQTTSMGVFSSRAAMVQPSLVTNLMSAGGTEETGLVWREVDPLPNPREASVRGSVAPVAQRPAVTVAGPGSAGEWASAAIASKNGTFVVWSQQEDGRMSGKGLDGGMSVNLTPSPAARAYQAASPPVLARSSPMIAVGFGSDGGLYGQLLCEP